MEDLEAGLIYLIDDVIAYESILLLQDIGHLLLKTLEESELWQ